MVLGTCPDNGTRAVRTLGSPGSRGRYAGSEVRRRTVQRRLCCHAKYSQGFRTDGPIYGGLSKIVPCAPRNDYFEHRRASSWRSSSSGIPCPLSSWAIPSSMARRVDASSTAINSGTGWSILNSIIPSPLMDGARGPTHCGRHLVRHGRRPRVGHYRRLRRSHGEGKNMTRILVVEDTAENLRMRLKKWRAGADSNC